MLRSGVMNDDRNVLKLGADVRVSSAVSGFGGELDRYGVVQIVSLTHLSAFVRTKRYSGWVRLEDLTRVGCNDETTAPPARRMGTLEAVVDEIAMDARSLMVAAIEAAQEVT